MARAVDRFEQLPPLVRYGALILPLLLWPAIANTDYLLQVGVDTLIYVLLALGLNVAVGWAGLLDLGYIAFFGFGAYGYALLDSGQFDLHLQAQWAIPLVVAGTVVLGFLLGLPSRRLSGDYLAIVTLFFFQVFLTLLNNADRLNIPGFGAQDITGGPNGISDIDPFTFFGVTLTTVTQYYYVAVAAIAIVMTALYLVNHSRTGRAWRAMREDELAAEVMSMPVDWLKLLAFAFGAGVAGLTGTILAAQQGAVFPVNFDLTILITLYAMVILGGTGSLGGVVDRGHPAQRLARGASHAVQREPAVLRRSPARARARRPAVVERDRRARRDDRVRARGARDRFGRLARRRRRPDRGRHAPRRPRRALGDLARRLADVEPDHVRRSRRRRALADGAQGLEAPRGARAGALSRGRASGRARCCRSLRSPATS